MIQRLACISAAIVFAAVAAVPAAASTVDCNTPLDGVERAELVQLFDPATLTDSRDGQRRLDRISAILNGHHDRRGTFPIFYRHVLATLNETPNSAWIEELSVRYLRIFLENGHAHFTGGAVSPAWTRYYALAADCRRSAGRVGLTGMNVHLIIDLPHAIAATGATPANAAEFREMGERLVRAADAVSAEMKSTYGADVGEAFHLYLVGTMADVLLGRGGTTSLLFQGVRAYAFQNGLLLRQPLTAGPALLLMEAAFAGLELAGAV